MECTIHDVTPGVPILYCLYGNMDYVHTAAASRTGEIPSCLDTNPEFQHQPFQQWQIELRPTLIDTGQSGWVPPGTRRITIGELEL